MAHLYKHLTREAKEEKIQRFVALWYEFHERYAQLFSEYESEIEIKKSLLRDGEPLRKAYKESYCPKWAEFLLLDSESEVIEHFKRYSSRSFRGVCDYIFRENILIILRALNNELRAVRRYNKRGGELSRCEFGAMPSSCGTGRHRQGARDSTQYGSYYWPR